MKFRSKPVVIEAEQYPGGNLTPGICDCADFAGPHAHGKQGPVRVNVGDWLIAEADGSGYYPCASDIFARKYEQQ